jgi:hypothetical protein
VSLYNQLHGRDQFAPLFLQWLNIDQANGEYESGRFRDIHLSGDGSRLILYTRNGGGNRPSYQHVFDGLSKHPNYIKDYDDDFDNTYAYIEFSVPDEMKTTAEAFATGVDPKTIHQKFVDIQKEMSSMTPDQLRADPRFAPTVKMFEAIEKGDVPPDGVFRV